MLKVSSVQLTITSIITLLLFINLFSYSHAQFNDYDRSSHQLQTCLKLASGLEYAQHEAPTDITDLIALVTQELNQQGITGVRKVEVKYDGDQIHQTIGSKTIYAHVTSSEHGKILTRCYEVNFIVYDTDECLLPENHPMRHNCDPSSICRNVVGSYECDCPPGWFGVDGSGSIEKENFLKRAGQRIIREFIGREIGGHCGGHRSTETCCNVTSLASRCDKIDCLQRCKGDFKCRDDPCKYNKCHRHAVCIPGEGSKYTCQCKQGWKGDGKNCKPVDLPNYCLNHTCPCNCHCVLHFDEIGYSCEPDPGFVVFDSSELKLELPRDHFSFGGVRMDNWVCVDASPPKMELKCDNPMYRQQGDTYKECGVSIFDNNKEDFARLLDIEYLPPLGPGGPFFTQIGEYQVVYTLSTPWLPKKTHQRVRTIYVDDVDECIYNGPAQQFHHTCAPDANCINTFGSYRCECPVGYVGDGFVNGTGCVDRRAPFLQCHGISCTPMIFQTFICHGFEIIENANPFLCNHANVDDRTIESYLLKLGNICGDQSTPCFTAVDIGAHNEVEDLTEHIIFDRLIKSIDEPNTWVVPVRVNDYNGNEARTEIKIIIQHLTAFPISSKNAITQSYLTTSGFF